MIGNNGPPVTLHCVLDADVPPFCGRLQGWEESGLVRVAVPFEVAERAILRLETKERFSATGYVVYCVPWQEGYRLAIQLQDERRAEPRLPADQSALIYVYGTQAMRIAGRVVDLSRTGMGLRLHRPLPVGSLIKVVTDEAISLGEVRHCARVADEDGLFKAGIRIATTGARPAPRGLLGCARQWLSATLRNWPGKHKRQVSA